MKNVILFVLILFFATSANAQSVNGFGTHNLDFGPFAGYNLKTKGPAYGAGINYEYRPFEKWGFTAGMKVLVSANKLLICRVVF